MAFTDKQTEFFKNANKRWNFKVGAVRSGKTYMDYFLIPQRIRERAEKAGLVVIMGVTKSTIERNILEPMRQIWGSLLVGEINSQNKCFLFGEIVYCLGAEKKSQITKIRGMSVKYAYGDEVADWNPEVFELLKSRLDKEYSCFDGALNPQGPNHWLLPFLQSDMDRYVQHYTIFDNPYLPTEVINSLCREYAGSVYYKRYILGEWAIAEGLVYPMFSEKNIKRGMVEKNRNRKYYVSIDYGTVNPFAVGIFEYDPETRVSVMIKELHYAGRDEQRCDNEEYYTMLKQLIGELRVEFIIVDPSATGFIETIKKHGRFVVKGAENDVLNGIQEVTKYLNYDILKIHESCIETLKEFEQYAWDDKSHEDKVIKESDHHMDLIRYYIYSIARKLNRWVV